MSLLSFALIPFSRFLAFSAVRPRSKSTSAAGLPPLRWKHCLDPLPPARVRFPGSASDLPGGLAPRPSLVQRGLSAVPEDLLHNTGAAAAILAGGYALVYAFDELTRRKVLHQVFGSVSCVHRMNIVTDLLLCSILVLKFLGF